MDAIRESLETVINVLTTDSVTREHAIAKVRTYLTERGHALYEDSERRYYTLHNDGCLNEHNDSPRGL